MSANFEEESTITTSHPLKGRLCFYILTASVSFTLFSLRFPWAYIYPNFYAEDGKNFAVPVYQTGLLDNFLTPFNGSLISGIYLISYLAVLMVKGLGIHFMYLPLIQSIITNIVFALIFALPVFLFGQDRKTRIRWMFFSICATMIPLGQFQYEVVGVAGNLKWMSLYAAFLLFVYRGRLNAMDRQVFIIDACILANLFTLPTVSVIVALVGLDTTIEAIKRKSISFTKFYSTATLGLLSLYPILVAATNDHAPPNGSAGTFQYSKAIEFFAGRNFIYPLVPSQYSSLNDYIALTLTFLLFFILIKSNRDFFIKTFFVIIVSLVLLAINRGGLSNSFHEYSWPTFSRFFYAQNLVLIFSIFFHLRASRLFGVLAILLSIQYLAEDLYRPSSNFMYETIGSISENITSACDIQIGEVKRVSINIYPTKDWSVVLDRAIACQK